EEAKKLTDQMSVMQNELQQKFQDYANKRDSLPDLIRATIEKDLQDTQTRIQSFQQLAQQSLSKKEADLMQPILENYQKALEEVAKENNYIYVFDTSSQVLLYTSTQSIDASPYVKAKMTK
ncbi:MAG: OmpH family outer membrane protein, partial [Bacteroidales bacterium]|nr:OmpH family outer membrane protein [Bacteroidales bacterium]